MIETIWPERKNVGLGGDVRPHVLLILDQFPKILGGGERIVLKLAELLPQYGYRASILTFFIHPENTSLESPPCAVYLLPLQRTYDLTAFRAALSLRRFLKAHRIALVETFFESSDIWAGLVTKTMSSAKLVWSRRDMGILRSRKHEVAYRLMAGFPDAVFAVSEQVRRHCIYVDRVDPARIETIYNGLEQTDWKGFDQRNRSAEWPVLLTVGNIRRVKGHDVLIKALARLRPNLPTVLLHIAGDVLDPVYFEELKAMIHDLKLSDCVRFLGGVKDLREELQRASVFVLPSRSEGFSNAIVEAMAASLPIVATDVGGNAEAVRDGVDGFIVPPENPAALADGLRRILLDRALAERMGRSSRQAVVERFTTQSMMQRITRTYARLLADRT